MSLRDLMHEIGEIGFPRVSGDEPLTALNLLPLRRFSPRERG